MAKVTSVYVASSWRNDLQPVVVQYLREEGFDVYDFKNPPHGKGGFGWSTIDPAWKEWRPEKFRESLDNPLAIEGYTSDMNALVACDACVLVWPSGKSAHLEAGWAAGAGKKTCLFIPNYPPQEPELMVKMLDEVCLSLGDISRYLRRFS